MSYEQVVIPDKDEKGKLVFAGNDGPEEVEIVHATVRCTNCGKLWAMECETDGSLGTVVNETMLPWEVME